MINHIQKSCGLKTVKFPTTIYEDNATCVAQMQTGYIKNDLTKHISPKFFYPHELQKKGQLNIVQVRSCDNLADLFTKSLPATTFRRYGQEIGMKFLKDFQNSGGVKL
jgi:hypothetical protein